MEPRDTRFLKISADFVRDVILASQRSSHRDKAGQDRLGPTTAGMALPDQFLNDEDSEGQDSDPVSAEEWIETQLLDCQNLARQHGLSQLANLLDKALDLLAEEAENNVASPPDTMKGVVLPFRVG